jgi:carbonic anhydrase/acetyltransferase-like protein (isoleucine patch superfamily)
MAQYRFRDRVPKIHSGAWVSDSARVIGDVEVGKDCYIGHGAVLRGDYGSIRLGPGTAIEENVTVHIRPDGLCEVGERVTVGHGAILHCNRVADYAVIGMGAIVSFEAEVGEWTIIAEGCVVRHGMKLAAGKIYAGAPAREVGAVKQSQKDFWTYGKQLYVDLASRYPRDFERIG